MPMRVWINQIREREDVSCKVGRPMLEYTRNRENSNFELQTIFEKTCSNIGIPLIQNLMQYYQITETLAENVQKDT